MATLLMDKIGHPNLEDSGVQSKRLAGTQETSITYTRWNIWN